MNTEIKMLSMREVIAAVKMRGCSKMECGKKLLKEQGPQRLKVSIAINESLTGS